MSENGPNFTEAEDSPDTLLGTDGRQKSMVSRLRQSLWKDVDPEQSSIPLAAYCFITGFMDSITFTAVSVWCGFQTGNTIELALALSRYFAISNTTASSTRLVDYHCLISITCFLSGAFLGRIGDCMGPRTRGWLFFGTMFQALCTFLAAILLWQASQDNLSVLTRPVWNSPGGYAAMAFSSASMGLQGIMGKRVNTQFATTVVLTSVWCELMADPRLFCARLVRTRDLKLIAVGVLFLGGFLGRLLLDEVGSAATFLIGSMLRLLIALLWLRVPHDESIVLL